MNPTALGTVRLRCVAVWIFLSACCACSRPPVLPRLPPDWPQLTPATSVNLDTDPMDTGRFFHEEEFPWPNHNGIVARRLAQRLGALREPSFICAQPDDPGFEAYRFFWVPSFFNPIVVRVMRSGDSAPLLWATESAQSNICERGRTRSGILTNEQWDALKTKIAAAGFWNAKSQLTRGTEGSAWVFEGVREGRHHVVMRDGPYPGDPFRALGLHLLALSGIVPSGPP